jgi:dTMP kinase
MNAHNAVPFFQKLTPQPMFIAFEGLDGSGSSTQVRLLSERLERTGHKTLVTKEPTGTNPIGRLIREVLQHRFETSPEGLQLLFAADRAEHLRVDILPALKEGKIVLTDRYLFSTIAFGSYGVTDMDWLKQLNRLYPLPDITFLFKLDPELCIQRIQGRGTTFELFEKAEKLKVIWKNYEKISHDFPNFHLIDAAKSIAEISDTIWGAVEKRVG